jgi:hypothetical protein
MPFTPAFWMTPPAQRCCSIGSLGRDKSHLLYGEGPINCLLSRDHRRLFVMRLASHDCATGECGPSPHVPPDAFDDRVFDSSIFHIGRTGGSGISFQASIRMHPDNERWGRASPHAGFRARRAKVHAVMRNVLAAEGWLADWIEACRRRGLTFAPGFASKLVGVHRGVWVSFVRPLARQFSFSFEVFRSSLVQDFCAMLSFFFRPHLNRGFGPVRGDPDDMPS